MLSQQVLDAVRQSPITWFVVGFVTCWSLLTVIRQEWTDAVTRQNLFGIALGIGAIAVFVLLVIPYATWGLVIGVLGTAGLAVAAFLWFNHFR